MQLLMQILISGYVVYIIHVVWSHHSFFSDANSGHVIIATEVICLELFQFSVHF